MVGEAETLSQTRPVELDILKIKQRNFRDYIDADAYPNKAHG